MVGICCTCPEMPSGRQSIPEGSISFAASHPADGTELSAQMLSHPIWSCHVHLLQLHQWNSGNKRFSSKPQPSCAGLMELLQPSSWEREKSWFRWVTADLCFKAPSAKFTHTSLSSEPRSPLTHLCPLRMSPGQPAQGVWGQPEKYGHMEMLMQIVPYIPSLPLHKGKKKAFPAPMEHSRLTQRLSYTEQNLEVALINRYGFSHHNGHGRKKMSKTISTCPWTSERTKPRSNFCRG